MESNLLDNPGWHALNSHHRHLAIQGILPNSTNQAL